MDINEIAEKMAAWWDKYEMRIILWLVGSTALYLLLQYLR